jgi:glycosyltransferase involved in cell wall biosynthesis
MNTGPPVRGCGCPIRAILNGKPNERESSLPMHALIVNQYALPSGSAGITRHGDLARELAERGHRVSVIASRFNYLTRSSELQPARRGTRDGVVFHWLRTGSYAGNDQRRVRSMVQFMLRATWAGVALRDKPDVVIGSSPQLLAGLSGLLVARRFRVPFLFEVRDPWPSALVDLGAISAGGLTNKVLETIERRLYRHAKRIITVMAHADRRVAEVGEDPGKCVHIPNAAAYPPSAGVLPPRLEEQLRQEAASGRTVVMYAGAHGVSNGLHEVRDALTQLRETDRSTYEGLALFFIGDGPEKESLQRAAALQQHDHVHFHEAVPKPSMIAAMQRADFILVHFARAEFKRYGMSANKLFDAMALARPVLLASPLRDTPVDEVRCGIRYEPGSARELADALKKALRSSTQEREGMGRAGQAEAELRYNLKVTGAQLEQLLVEVTRG